MKTKKILSRITAWVLTLAMIFALVPTMTFTVSAATDAFGTGWSFTAATGTLTVTSNYGTNEWRDGRELGDSPVDFSINDVKTVIIYDSVKSIGDLAFMDCENLATVTFGDNSQLETIGQSAFSATDLTSIEIPDSVQSIGYGAFAGCYNLETVTFGDSSQLKTIEDYAFDNTGITSITIPAGVINIGSEVTNY